MLIDAMLIKKHVEQMRLNTLLVAVSNVTQLFVVRNAFVEIREIESQLQLKL